jgi:hypothetical protein
MAIMTLLKYAPLLEIKPDIHGTLVKILEHCMHRVGKLDCPNLVHIHAILRPGLEGR